MWDFSHGYSILFFLGAISATGYFTNNIWPFHILDINCTGEEDNIFDCTHNEMENYMCLWSHDASIVCQGQYNPIGIMKHFEMCSQFCLSDVMKTSNWVFGVPIHLM